MVNLLEHGSITMETSNDRFSRGMFIQQETPLQLASILHIRPSAAGLKVTVLVVFGHTGKCKENN